MVDDEEGFPHPMVLDQPMGMATGTDFARYIVEPKLRGFDIADSDPRPVFRWFLREVTTQFGYPGANKHAAHFDWALIREFGSGRGKKGYAERLGKKYYWILLARLVGVLSDHLVKSDYGETPRPKSSLQGVDLRDIDPTDIRTFVEDAYECTADVWAVPAIYRFDEIEATDFEGWVKRKDLPKPDEAIVVEGKNDAGAPCNWVVLCQYVDWRAPTRGEDEDSTQLSRRVFRSTQSVLVDISNMSSLETQLKKHGYEPSSTELVSIDYRGYIGEYPETYAYRDRVAREELSFTMSCHGVTCYCTAFNHLKGNEWGYDHSGDEPAENLRVPGPALVANLGLHWDGSRSWLDAKDERIAFEFRCGDYHTLLIRQDALDQYLADTKQALVHIVYQEKYAMATSAGALLGRFEERLGYKYVNANLSLLGKKTKIWSSD